MYDYDNRRKKDESERIRFENAHPAIVSKEVFILAKERSKLEAKKQKI